LLLLKKIIGPMFMPAFVCIEILLVGLLLLWFTKKQRAGKIVVTIGIVLLLGFGYELFPNRPLMATSKSPTCGRVKIPHPW
jgi:hypothetical protein